MFRNRAGSPVFALDEGEREFERQRTDGAQRRAEAPEQPPVRVGCDGHAPRAEPEPESRVAGRDRDAFVSAAVGIADDVDGDSRQLGQLFPPDGQRSLELLVGQAGERIVPEGVEADDHPGGDELAHLLAPHAGLLGIRPRPLEEPTRGPVALVGGHLHHRRPEAVQRVLGADGRADQRREVGDTGVPRALQALEVERERAVERRAAEEERRRHIQRMQDWRSERGVAREIVVERDGDGEALATTPRGHRVEQPVRRHHAVVADEVSQLALEQADLVRRHELASGVTRTAIHTVVHQRDAGLATRQPQEEHERDAHGHAHDPRDGPHDALRERRMSAHPSHGQAAEVLARPEVVAGFGEIAAEWDALAERSGSIFSTALWNRVWWSHFGRGRELQLHAVRNPDGALTTVLPLYAWRRRLPRVVRFLGHGPGDELGPVYARGKHGTAAAALTAALDALEWDVFLGEQLPGDEGWPDLLRGRLWRREASPTLALPPSWDEYLAGRSANFREQLRRRERALRREGAVRVRLADERTLDADLDTLFALHRARWGSTRTDFAASPFHRDVAYESLARGWLRLWLLELDGRPVAAWHGFHVGSVTSYYQAGRDPAADRLSVGFLLMARSIEAAIAEGAQVYRFGRGDEAFKGRFGGANDGLETVVLARGVAGASAMSVGRLARSARALVRGR